MILDESLKQNESFNIKKIKLKKNNEITNEFTKNREWNRWWWFRIKDEITEEKYKKTKNRYDWRENIEIKWNKFEYESRKNR